MFPPIPLKTAVRHCESGAFPVSCLLRQFVFSDLGRLFNAVSMARSASRTASARVSAMPVRILVASSNTVHFQQQGFVVSTS
jgi:hypothetical protein